MKRIAQIIIAGSLILSSQAAEFTMTFNTVQPGGKYSPKNIVAVWVKKSDGTFVKTIMRRAGQRADDMATWKAASGGKGVDSDAVLGATRPNHTTPTPLTATWDMTDRAGSTVPNGTYQIWFCCDDGGERSYSFSFEKDGIAGTRTNPGITYFKDISIAYAPIILPPAPPEWDEDPITGSLGFVDMGYSDTLDGNATDPNSDPLTYSKEDGPDWLVVNPSSGALTGTPRSGDMGANTFTVEVADGNGGTDTAILNILVKASVLGDSPAIGINFSEEGVSRGLLAAATQAGLPGYIYPNWNTTTCNTGTQGSLIDSSGTPTMASVTWASRNTYRDGVANTDADAGVGDAQLAVGYLDDGNSGAEWTVSGIPFTTYTAVLYLSTDKAAGFYLPFTVNGVVHSTTGNKHRYTNPNWDETNTIVVTNLSGNLVVDGLLKAGDNRGCVAGFQIIDASPSEPVTDLAIAGPIAAGLMMELSWTGAAGQTYSVETNATLTSENWGSWRSDMGGSGAKITITTPINESQLFYRVVTEYINGEGDPSPVLDLMIAGPVLVASMMELSWTGNAGQTYNVETNANLADGIWNSWTSGVVGVDAKIIISTPINEDQLFYRVITE